MRIGSIARQRALFAAVFVAAATTPLVALAQSWVAQGPFGITSGQVEGNSGGTMAAQGRPVSGAVEALLAHPTDANILFAATTNGGIWRTTNATSTNPTWTPLTDDQSSLSMSSITFDRSDPTGNTIWAGNGRHSSYSRLGGTRAGLLKSTDGGDTWTRVTPNFNLRQARAIVANGSTVVVAVDQADSFTYSNIGLYRSINGGTTFSALSGAIGTGFPQAIAADLVADPNNPSILYSAAIVPASAGNQGIYRSTDFGATWTRVSSAAVNSSMSSTNTSKIRLSVGNAGQVFVGIVVGGNPTAIYRSPDGLGSWTALDLPQTVDSGTTNGLNPGGFNPDRYFGPIGDGQEQIYGQPGGQGSLHFSVAADPTDPNVVYVGGDRQPNPFPNALGANDFSGRLFRINASLAAGSQASSLTHRVGVSTTDNSAPHADSRSIVFDANGQLIEGDDGGVYRRTNPQGLGAWSGLMGNMQNTETHSVAYDSNTDTFIAGTQDVGTPESLSPGSTGSWRSVATADGGQVAVYSPAGSNSVRYSSFQNLGSFRRRVVNAANTVVSTSFPALTVTSTGTSIYTTEGSMPFYTPIAVSEQTGNLFIGARRAYESTNGGTSLTVLRDFGSGITTTSIAAGADDNPDVVAFGTSGGTNRVFLRTSAAGALNPLPAYDAMAGAGAVAMLSISNRSFTDLAVVDSNQVFVSFNTGANFTDITGTLISGGRSGLLSVAMASNPSGDIIFVGLNTGDVYYTTTIPTFGGLGTWTLLGDLPNAPVFDMEYNAVDDVLVVGLLGRGIHSFANAAGQFTVPVVPEPAVAGLIPVFGLALRRRRR